MNAKNYTIELKICAPASQVYKALSSEIGTWWGNSNEGVSQVGDIMHITFSDNPSQWTFQATELVVSNRVVLTCIDALHIHTGLPESIQHEWKDSQLIINISEEEGVSRIEFTHLGLTPELDCYDVCVEGWNYFIGKALENYVQRLQAVLA